MNIETCIYTYCHLHTEEATFIQSKKHELINKIILTIIHTKLHCL
jgi:hypothetical protein